MATLVAVQKVLSEGDAAAASSAPAGNGSSSACAAMQVGGEWAG